MTTFNAHITDNSLTYLHNVYGLKGTGLYDDDDNGNTDSRTDINHWLAQLETNAAYNPFDAIDLYLPHLEEGQLGDLINESGDILTRSLNSLTAKELHYDSEDYDFFSYLSYDGSNDTTYTLTSDGGLTLNNLDYDPQDFFDNTVATWSDSNKNKNKELLYKNLASELEDLKHYTLTNQEILDIQSQIDSIEENVLPQLEEKISTAEEDFEKILSIYADVTDNGVTEPTEDQLYSDIIKGIFPDGGTDQKFEAKIYNLSSIYNYNKWDAYFNNEIFGEDSTPDKFTDNLFFEYQIAKRSNSNLDFKTYMAEKHQSFVASDKIQSDDDFTPSDYGLEEGSKQRDMVDVFTDHYIYDEMHSLYQQYEDYRNKLISLKVSLEVAGKYSAEFEYRKELAEIMWNNPDGLSEASKKLLTVENSKISGLERGNEYGPSGMSAIGEYKPNTYGFYGNTPDPETDTTGYSTQSGGLVDPYQFIYNGTEYMIGIDQDTNGTIDDISEILGISDSYNNPFESLVSLDDNQDGIVSRDEMLSNNVIFNAVNNKGKLSSSTLDASLIKEIDLLKLQKVNDPDGKIAGTFEIKMKNNTTLAAEQTFEDQAYFNNLFGTIVDLRPYQTSTSLQPEEIAPEQTSSEQTDETEKAEVQETEEKNTYYQNLMSKLDSIYGDLSIEKSASEQLLDKLCWETGHILTPAQRLKVIETTKYSDSPEEMEQNMRRQLEMLNISV